VVDECVVHEAGVDDLPPDGVGQRDVATDVETQPYVGPLGRCRAAGIDRVQTRPSPDPLQDVMEEDRVRLPRVRTPQDDDVRVLDFFI
jgi:hypothetical protein